MNSLPPIGSIQVVHWHLVKVLQHGSTTAIGTPLPNCVQYEYVGMRRLDGRWWDVDWMTPERERSQADAIYFTPWDGNGILFGSKKAEQLLDLLNQQSQLQPGKRTAKQSRDEALHTQLQKQSDALEIAMDALCETPAADTPFEQPDLFS